MFIFLRRLAAVVGAYGSLVVLVVSIGEPDTGFSSTQTVLIFGAIGLGAAALFLEIHDFWVSRPTVKKTSRVPAFLEKWIRDGSRVAIFSRNMSWVNDPIHELLLAKAGANDLTVVLPRETTLSAELAGRGAEVLTYPELDYEIQSRFTIINLGHGDAHIAIGQSLGNGKHRIEKLSARTHPAFIMAEDLIALTRGFNRYRGR